MVSQRHSDPFIHPGGHTLTRHTYSQGHWTRAERPILLRGHQSRLWNQKESSSHHHRCVFLTPHVWLSHSLHWNILCVLYSQSSRVEESSYWSALYLTFGGYHRSSDRPSEENVKPTQKKASDWIISVRLSFLVPYFLSTYYRWAFHLTYLSVWILWLYQKTKT